MALLKSRTLSQAAVIVSLAVGFSLPGLSQTVAQQTTAQSSSSAKNAAPPARHRSRPRWRYVAPAATQGTAANPPVGPIAEQRARDAQILAAQKAQSAEIARQNAVTTGNVVRERTAQQAEPRIQDAPGPGSQPLAGDPAVPPKVNNDPQAIQDAPGPAQTLPQAPPAQPAQPQR